MTEEAIREAVSKTNGKIFSVSFIKKDNTLRKMTCRVGVTKYLKGGELPYDPIAKGLLSVWDMQANGYRMINLKTIQNISLEVEDEVSNANG
jgi:hypothetical protein